MRLETPGKATILGRLAVPLRAVPLRAVLLLAALLLAAAPAVAQEPEALGEEDLPFLDLDVELLDEEGYPVIEVDEEGFPVLSLDDIPAEWLGREP